MSSEVMLLILLCSMTILSYMIAINAHGLFRLIISYLLATVMLAASVYSIVQHVNIGLDSVKMEELKKLEAEKKSAEDRANSQEEALKSNKDRMNFAGKLSIIITGGAATATSIINIDLQDKSFELENLIKRAADTKRTIETIKQDLEKLSTSDQFFKEPLALCKEAIPLLTEAGYYFSQYYNAEDSDQEALRERIMRQKARAAYEKFQKASVLIATSG